MIWEIILAVVAICSIYVNWNLFRKTEELEDANDELSVWVDEYRLTLTKILDKITDLDSKKMFESDDEVGSLYKQISDTIKELKEFRVDNNEQN